MNSDIDMMIIIIMMSGVSFLQLSGYFSLKTLFDVVVLNTPRVLRKLG